MAAYYALLAKAVGALPLNDEASRRDIYVKARSALIRQLKAIAPPLPPSEISKQRLALEEAIRKVEREAVEAAAATMLSEEEIARRAEQALEEALTSPAAGDEAPPLEDTPPVAEPFVESGPSAPSSRPEPMPPPRGVQPRPFHPNARPEPEVVSPRTAPGDPPPAAETFAEVVRPIPGERQAARAATWERAANVTDVEETPPAARARRDRAADPRRGGRGWETAPKRQRKQRSIGARLTILTLFLVVVAVGAYFVWQNWDTVREAVTDFVASVTGNETAVETPEIVAEGDVPAEGAAVPEEPPVFVEAQAYLYEEPPPNSPEAPKYLGTVQWTLAEDETTSAVIVGTIAIPQQGLTIGVRITESVDPAFSHEISVLVTQAAQFASDPLVGVENLAVKTTEEAIGVAFQGTEVAREATFYFLGLPENARLLTLNRFNSPWFDMALVFQSGRRAIVTFSKGTPGDDIFARAIAAWEG